MTPLASVAIGAALYSIVVGALALTVFRPTVRAYREPSLREQLRALDVRGAK